MNSIERPDDFSERREKLRPLSDDELHARFWSLVEQLLWDKGLPATTSAKSRSKRTRWV